MDIPGSVCSESGAEAALRADSLQQCLRSLLRFPLQKPFQVLLSLRADTQRALFPLNCGPWACWKSFSLSGGGGLPLSEFLLPGPNSTFAKLAHSLPSPSCMVALPCWTQGS
jgi:hypothetical protein